MPQAERRSNKWAIRKEISVGNLVTIGIIIMGTLNAYFSLDKRVALVEKSIAEQAVVDKAQDAERLAGRMETNERLYRIELKLDDVIKTMGMFGARR